MKLFFLLSSLEMFRGVSKSVHFIQAELLDASYVRPVPVDAGKVSCAAKMPFMFF